MKKKGGIDGKVKSKLNFTFFILYYFDPISFHIIKNFKQKKQKKTKESLNFNIKSFSNRLIKYSFNLNLSKNNKKEDLLLIKNYLTFLFQFNYDQFNYELKQSHLNTLFLNKPKKLNLLNDFYLNSFESFQSFSFLRGLNYLEDFLNV